ncbi:hypothetical protein PM082_023769 [Marasmius tenuissimus]|nr:hypothetical protein PM082_023769 [Marasmius tenuissimus]
MLLGVRGNLSVQAAHNTRWFFERLCSVNGARKGENFLRDTLGLRRTTLTTSLLVTTITLYAPRRPKGPRWRTCPA